MHYVYGLVSLSLCGALVTALPASLHTTPFKLQAHPRPPFSPNQLKQAKLLKKITINPSLWHARDEAMSSKGVDALKDDVAQRVLVQISKTRADPATEWHSIWINGHYQAKNPPGESPEWLTAVVQYSKDIPGNVLMVKNLLLKAKRADVTARDEILLYDHLGGLGFNGLTNLIAKISMKPSEGKKAVVRTLQLDRWGLGEVSYTWLPDDSSLVVQYEFTWIPEEEISDLELDPKQSQKPSRN